MCKQGSSVKAGWRVLVRECQSRRPSQEQMSTPRMRGTWTLAAVWVRNPENTVNVSATEICYRNCRSLAHMTMPIQSIEVQMTWFHTKCLTKSHSVVNLGITPRYSGVSWVPTWRWCDLPRRLRSDKRPAAVPTLWSDCAGSCSDASSYWFSGNRQAWLCWLGRAPFQITIITKQG